MHLIPFGFHVFVANGSFFYVFLRMFIIVLLPSLCRVHVTCSINLWSFNSSCYFFWVCLDGGGGEGNKGKDREGLINLVEMLLKGEGEGFEGIWRAILSLQTLLFNHSNWGNLEGGGEGMGFTYINKKLIVNFALMMSIYIYFFKMNKRL